MNRKFVPEIHDPILIEMNTRWRRTDQEIADEMGFDKQTIAKHRARLGLPTNFRPRPTIYAAPEKEPALPQSKPNPLSVARMWLGRRLTEKPSGYFLDGVPVGLTTIMKATNRLMKAEGAEQLVYSEEWRV